MATESTFMPAPIDTPRGLELLYGVLFRPADTFRALGPESPLGAGALTMLGVAAIWGFAMGPHGPVGVALAMLIALGWLFLTWLLITGALFIVGRLITGRGEVASLMGATALTFLPLGLIGPAAAFAGMGKGGVLLAALFFVAALSWWIRLLQAAARGAMAMTNGQAVMALVGTELLLAAVPTTYFMLWLLTLAMALSGG